MDPIKSTAPVIQEYPVPYLLFTLVLVIAIGIFIAIENMANLSDIQNNWSEYRCQPQMMPLAGFFGYSINENFELLGTNNDIFQIKNEVINTDVKCYINNDETNIGHETIITTNDGQSIKTCDFGEAIDNSCDHLVFNCKTDTCNEVIKPILNINGDYRCRKIPYKQM